MMAPVGFGMRLSRLSTLRASSNGQALLTWAYAKRSVSTSILGAPGFLRPLSSASGMLASACGSALRRAGLIDLARGVFGRRVLFWPEVVMEDLASELMNQVSVDKFHRILNDASISGTFGPPNPFVTRRLPGQRQFSTVRRGLERSEAGEFGP